MRSETWTALRGGSLMIALLSVLLFPMPLTHASGESCEKIPNLPDTRLFRSSNNTPFCLVDNGRNHARFFSGERTS